LSFRLLDPPDDVPHHGVWDRIAFGGQAEARFAHDRVAGVGNPDWASVQRVSGFAVARVHDRLWLLGEVAYDRATDDLVVERALVDLRLRETVALHGGVLPLPLGRANLERDAPRGEFTDRSLVATALIGVPSSQLGVGVRGLLRRASFVSYELDAVTGYDDGLIDDSPDGTRVPRGRNGWADNNGIPALAGRIALHPGPGAELGLGALAGPYNRTDLDGVTVDRSRALILAVADGATAVAGVRLAGEAALVTVDVPPGLQPLFAEQQWGASLEAARTLRQPLIGAWARSSLGAALRADAVDFDRAIPGDSKSRLSASANVRPGPSAVLRFGWYYELRRDRFDNPVPAAGLVLSAASYF
jgi:hypothetical protein